MQISFRRRPTRIIEAAQRKALKSAVIELSRRLRCQKKQKKWEGKEKGEDQTPLVRRFCQYGQRSSFPLRFSSFPFERITRAARVSLYGVIRVETQILDRGIHVRGEVFEFPLRSLHIIRR